MGSAAAAGLSLAFTEYACIIKLVSAAVMQPDQTLYKAKESAEECPCHLINI
jgi:hypothetical protein